MARKNSKKARIASETRKQMYKRIKKKKAELLRNDKLFKAKMEGEKIENISK